MQLARRISQSFFLIFFIYLFFKATFPYDAVIPSDIFLRSDPLVAITTIIMSTEFLIGTFIIAFIFIILTVFLGRVFCGWVCPLGTVIDFSDRITAKARKWKNDAGRSYRVWKYSILILVLFAAILSVQLIWFMDPIALITRTFTLTIYPVFSFFVESIFNLLIKLGWFEDTVFSLYDSFRGSIIPLEPLHFQQSVAVVLMFGGILGLGLLAKRFWCRYLCPLGAFYALLSKFRILKRSVNDNCIDCGRCYRNCKMDAITEDFRSYSRFECIECMNCVNICPTDAFEYSLKAERSPIKTDVSKRRFVFSGLAGLMAVGITKTAFMDKNNVDIAIRPPGALEEDEFLDRCIRCQECVKICSTTGRYLQPALLESGWEGIWTPIADPRSGYCEYDCVLCGKVCPTGAIHSLTVEQKKKLPLGTARFNK
ncbi:4Fe-4S binding protein, partial [candidate division KSB1 bacterium]|nr:4Fe-4S binding protein [candidate division KSB1 bacterium]